MISFCEPASTPAPAGGTGVAAGAAAGAGVASAGAVAGACAWAVPGAARSAAADAVPRMTATSNAGRCLMWFIGSSPIAGESGTSVLEFEDDFVLADKSHRLGVEFPLRQRANHFAVEDPVGGRLDLDIGDGAVRRHVDPRGHVPAHALRDRLARERGLDAIARLVLPADGGLGH